MVKNWRNQNYNYSRSNKKIGNRSQEDPKNIEHFSLEERNIRGKMLVNFILKEIRNETQYAISNAKHVCCRAKQAPHLPALKYIFKCLDEKQNV